jgi:glycosyltransferase involved in cell wall biosynthesis
VIAESLACGTPVLASRVGGIPEMVAWEDGGILVPPGDVDALAAGLVAIAERSYDPGQVAASSNARPWSTQARHIADVYRALLVGAGG